MFANSRDIRAFVESNRDIVAVSVSGVKGSTPRNEEAWMLVSPIAIFGTIGGGNLEYMAIDQARKLLNQQGASDHMSVPLGPEIGQCCGGHVTLDLKRLDKAGMAVYIERQAAELASLPRVYIFGAGHVGRALAQALSLLPLSPVVVDTRAEELAEVPEPIETVLSAMPESLVTTAPPGSGFVILTHDHSLDFLIAAEALKRRDAVYIGMIGSKTKRAVFDRWYKAEFDVAEPSDKLICPIGKTASKDKRPEVIASFVAAEIMEQVSVHAETVAQPQTPHALNC